MGLMVDGWWLLRGPGGPRSLGDSFLSRDPHAPKTGTGPVGLGTDPMGLVRFTLFSCTFVLFSCRGGGTKPVGLAIARRMRVKRSTAKFQPTQTHRQRQSPPAAIRPAAAFSCTSPKGPAPFRFTTSVIFAVSRHTHNSPTQPFKPQRAQRAQIIFGNRRA